MSISLQKGQKVSLTKESAGLSKVIIGLGWDEVKRSKGFSRRSRRRLTAMHLLFCFMTES